MSADEQLVRMANDIGNFFRSQPNREDALAGIANHIKSFWTRRMREKIEPFVKDDGSALDELPRAALRRLIEQPTALAEQPPGGDAG
jgi:formate dehydrogenase subunit delta